MKDYSYDPNKTFKVPTFTNAAGQQQIYSVYQEMFDIVMNDSWASISLWGKQRRGKSTVALWIAYFLWRLIDPSLSEPELWDRVYDSIIFNLSQILYKIDSPAMHRVWDWKHKHKRIPVFIWDDFSVHSNKAITQHESAFDEFKGAFDALGTDFGVLIYTMVNPDAPTTQLQTKYTHEIFVKERGLFKYDEVDWQQDFYGTNNRRRKKWKQDIPFYRIPDIRFDPYDQQRNQLAAEAKQRVRDKMLDGIPATLKRLTEEDINVLTVINELGPISSDNRAKYDPKSIIKLKAHQLVLPVARKGNHYSLDLTNLGLEIVKEHAKLAI